ncbi:MAG: response regulator, partial [Gallionellaceae bacterium]
VLMLNVDNFWMLEGHRPKIILGSIVGFWIVAGASIFKQLSPQDHGLGWLTVGLLSLIAAVSFIIAWHFLQAMRQLKQQAATCTSAQNITQIHANQLAASEGRIRAILHTMRDGVVHIDSQGIILLTNSAIKQMFGYEENELIGRNVSVLMAEPHHSSHDAYLSNYLLTRNPGILHRRVEVEGKRKDGSMFPIELAVNELIDDTGQTFLGLIRDITKRKAASEELDLALSSAQTATRAKSEFLANMSHEIRTPINAILGFSHLGLRLNLPPRGRDYFEKINSASNSLLGIINDILDFSKMDVSKLELEVAPFSLDDVLKQVGNLFRLKAKENGVELVIGTAPKVQEYLLGDALRLNQVLTNLLGNAIKFTKHGEISLKVSPVEITAENVTLLFEVRDTGIGMTAEQIEKLFIAFSQADSSTTRKYGGTGLGLAISKQLVELMGGELKATSSPDQGSCFSFNARFGNAKNEAAPLHSELIGKRVLVVDDNHSMRRLLSHNVAFLGCHVKTADSGETALAMLQAEKDYDLVLMDWHLGEAGDNGLVIAHRIRQLFGAIPIILISGDEAELARAQVGKDELGQDDVQCFLTKPVSSATLRDTMTAVLSGHAALPDNAVSNFAAPDMKGAHILLVDDNDFNRQVGRELIEISGATVVTANNGEQAVAAVRANHYDLVLMDLQMPVMDGYAATRELRSTHPDLPILALTAHAMIDERPRILSAGMNDILTKPIVPGALYTMLARWLPDKRKHDVETMPQGISAMQVDGAVAVIPINLLDIAIAENQKVVGRANEHSEVMVDGFDIPAALARVSGNHKMLERFLRLFRERNANNLEEIRAALSQQDIAQAKQITHTLKSSAGTVGAVVLQAAVLKLEETLIEAANDSARIEADFAVLETAWKQAMESLAVMLDNPI